MLQLAWLNGLTEFIMPYMVQTIKEMTGKVRWPYQLPQLAAVVAYPPPH